MSKSNSAVEPVGAVGRRAPRSGTPTALKYLRLYLGGRTHKKRAVMDLLHCSEATAKRLLSRKRPYTAGMKVSWVRLICAAVGKPESDVLGFRRPRLPREVLVGWGGAVTFSEAVGLATDCALVVVYLAKALYGLKGSLRVNYEDAGPKDVQVSLSPHPEMAVYGPKYAPHRLVLFMEGCHLFIQHIHPEQGKLDKRRASVEFIEKQLHKIHAHTKHHATAIAREAAKIRQ